jgi:hypothetical protein
MARLFAGRSLSLSFRIGRGFCRASFLQAGPAPQSINGATKMSVKATSHYAAYECGSKTPAFEFKTRDEAKCWLMEYRGSLNLYVYRVNEFGCLAESIGA